MNIKQLKYKLEEVYKQYHVPTFLASDPLGCVYRVEGARNYEIAGLVASVLAYGRVEIIIQNVNWVLDSMKCEPYNFVMSTSFQEKKKVFKNFRHRFNNGEDIALLLESCKSIYTEYPNLGSLLSSHNNDPTIKNSLIEFTATFRKTASSISTVTKGFEYLLPSPESGSACKRLNMYLRWMVRPKDGIDLGVWNHISSTKLLIPVDTHIAQISRQLKLTSRSSADFRMAEEITANLRKIDPYDPIRFDFSLCRAGMFSIRRNQ